ERRVTVAMEIHPLPRPSFGLATQNPLEMEGTYPLPEAQLDRFFFKIDVPMPSVEELVLIANRTTGAEAIRLEKVADGPTILAMQQLAREVPVASHVTAYAATLLTATHPDQPTAPSTVRDFVRFGSSPRGMQAMILAGKIIALFDGRFNVSFDDIRSAATPALRHRLILNFEAQAEGVSADDIVASLLSSVPTESRQPA
ncbi:MAG: MoxR family ATPase, partial [Anaerolineales bacterium]|nr:MoxR family ATPase [Anaerolineales bacterium]